MHKIQLKLCIALITIFSSGLVQTQPVSLGVFESIKIDATDDGYILRNSFTCPLRYISHYPPASGDELIIRIQPVPLCKSDLDSVKVRGSVKPHSDINNDIMEVTYEGDNPEGPSLVIYFRKAVKYSVSQGEDYRSVDVRVTSGK